MENIITDKIAFGGNCLTKINGKNVFVPFAIPGEELKVEIIQEKRDYDIAKISEIIKPSPHRVTPECKYYEKCGGCNMMHIDAEYQKELRKQILCDCLSRNGVDFPLEKINVISGDNFGYRARIQLNDGGFSERAGNQIIPVTDCLCTTKELNEWLSSKKMEERPSDRIHLFGCKNVISVGYDENKKISISSLEKKETTDYSKLKKKNKNIREVKKRYSGTSINTSDTIKVKILDKEVSFDVKGFFQSNIDVLEKAIKTLCKGLKGSACLDMYAGCGTFSVFLADIFKEITLVEHNRDALVFAEENLKGIKHQSFGLSGEKWVQTAENKYFDAVVIDPPRSGMEKEVCKWLCKSKIPQIRSVSCDPATHARDLSFLLKAGYELKELYLLDFYPNTSHIESLAILERDPE